MTEDRTGGAGPLCAVERMAALSDGVVAIAMTLLVLELKLPDAPPQVAIADLARMLADQGPAFWAWMVSFLLVARFWQEHHAIVARIHRCDRMAVGINFAFLALVSLIPFSSHLAGDHPRNVLSVVIFSATMVATALTLAALTRHIRRRGLHAADDNRHGGDDRHAGDQELGRQAAYLGIILPGVGLATVALAALGAESLALSLWGLEIVAVVLSPLRRRRLEVTGETLRSR